MEKNEMIFSLEVRKDEGRSNNATIKRGDEPIGQVALVYDERYCIFEGILVFFQYLEEKSIFKIGQLIQNTFLDSGDEMFLETYIGGVNYGLICDETPTIWDKMINV